MASTTDAPLALDPFDFHGRPASVISGLGGAIPGTDPEYAFHTHYVPVARGFAHFTLRFANLRAKLGTLVLRVHMLPSQPGATARMVTSGRIQLNRLVKNGGSISLRFEAFRGARYAVQGVIADQTDAEADDLVILLDHPGDGSQDDGPPGTIEDAASTKFTATNIRSSAHMISLAKPSFASPRAQPATVAQLNDREYRIWLARLSLPSSDHLDSWTLSYLAQAIKRYGMMEKGVSALSLSPLTERLLSHLEAIGASVRRLAIDCKRSQSLVGWTPLASRGLPGSYLAHDLVLSAWTDEAVSSKTVANTIEIAMECLRPGGLAVHVVPYSRDVSGDAAAFDRNGIERLMLSLASRGHDIARIIPALEERLLLGRDGCSAFGIVARRAQSML